MVQTHIVGQHSVFHGKIHCVTYMSYKGHIEVIRSKEMYYRIKKSNNIANTCTEALLLFNTLALVNVPWFKSYHKLVYFTLDEPLLPAIFSYARLRKSRIKIDLIFSVVLFSTFSKSEAFNTFIFHNGFTFIL